MSISAKQVKELRDRTGAGMMDCKKALVESDGDIDAAIEWLQVKGIAKAAKKSGRIAAEGLIDYWCSDDKRDALMIEVNCETDFVARNETFQTFVKELVNTLGPADVDSVEDALKVPFRGKTVDDIIKEQIATIGENIKLRRLIRVKTDEGFIATYIHNGSQLGVFTVIKGDDTDDNYQFGRDIAMQVAAMRPAYLSPEDISEEAVAKQREIFTAQVLEEGKPENIAPRIVDGKVKKWREENALYAQTYVKDTDLTVKKYEEKVGGVKIVKFESLEVGEGVEKVETNLADEVAAQLKNH